MDLNRQITKSPQKGQCILTLSKQNKTHWEKQNKTNPSHTHGLKKPKTKQNPYLYQNAYLQMYCHFIFV